MRTIDHPAVGAVKLGRRRPQVRHPRLKLGNYLMRGLPPAPATANYAPDASAALSQMYLNDKLGCCVISWMAHATGIFTGNATGGQPVIASDSEIEGAYAAIGGFDPANPEATDNGCDEETALAYWQSTGVTFGGALHKIGGYVSVNAADPEEMRIACWLFENLMWGVELPDAWLSGSLDWDVAGSPNPDNGHCFGSDSYGASSFGTSTWGAQGTITDAAAAAYAVPAAEGQLFTVVSADSIVKASQRAPSGVDYTQLMADLQAIS